jgi:hypothetical protein
VKTKFVKYVAIKQKNVVPNAIAGLKMVAGVSASAIVNVKNV